MFSGSDGTKPISFHVLILNLKKLCTFCPKVLFNCFVCVNSIGLCSCILILVNLIPSAICLLSNLSEIKPEESKI